MVVAVAGQWGRAPLLPPPSPTPHGHVKVGVFSGKRQRGGRRAQGGIADKHGRRGRTSTREAGAGDTGRLYLRERREGGGGYSGGIGGGGLWVGWHGHTMRTRLLSRAFAGRRRKSGHQKA